MQNVRT